MVEVQVEVQVEFDEIEVEPFQFVLVVAIEFVESIQEIAKTAKKKVKLVASNLVR